MGSLSSIMDRRLSTAIIPPMEWERRTVLTVAASVSFICSIASTCSACLNLVA